VGGQNSRVPISESFLSRQGGEAGGRAVQLDGRSSRKKVRLPCLEPKCGKKAGWPLLARSVLIWAGSDQVREGSRGFPGKKKGGEGLTLFGAAAGGGGGRGLRKGNGAVLILQGRSSFGFYGHSLLARGEEEGDKGASWGKRVSL